MSTDCNKLKNEWWQGVQMIGPRHQVFPTRQYSVMARLAEMARAFCDSHGDTHGVTDTFSKFFEPQSMLVTFFQFLRWRSAVHALVVDDA